MKVLITGSNGYIGKPLMIKLINRGIDVIGVDNNSREQWVNRCIGTRNKIPFTINTIVGDLADRDFVYEILQIHKPTHIIHLASQPSLPYSHINSERALFTQVNNLSMCINLLWGIKDICPECKLIITTTTGIPGQYYKEIPEEEVINKAGSFYHISRGFDSENCNLASRLWNLDILELRTSIVYGAVEEVTTIDTDFYFGTALNRFVKQALNKEPITIYGKGNQVKPFIALKDVVESLKNSLYRDIKGHLIMNQVTEHLSINELAQAVKDHLPTEIKYIDNPRKENENFKMTFRNDNFLHLLNKKPITVKESIQEIANCLRK